MPILGVGVPRHVLPIIEQASHIAKRQFWVCSIENGRTYFVFMQRFDCDRLSWYAPRHPEVVFEPDTARVVCGGCVRMICACTEGELASRLFDMVLNEQTAAEREESTRAGAGSTRPVSDPPPGV